MRSVTKGQLFGMVVIGTLAALLVRPMINRVFMSAGIPIKAGMN